MLSKLIHTVACIRISFLKLKNRAGRVVQVSTKHKVSFGTKKKAEYHSIKYTCHILLIHFTCQWTFVLLPPLAVVNNVANIQIPAFSSFGYIPRSRLARSCGDSMVSFLETTIVFLF
jgi:hypothetical protein